MQRCRIPLDRSPWRVNDPLGRVKRPKHSTGRASKFFSNAHLFSLGKWNLFTLFTKYNSISSIFGRFPVYLECFLCKGNSSDLFLPSLGFPNQNEATSARIFPQYVKMSNMFKNVLASVLSVRASVLFHSLDLQGEWVKVYTSAICRLIWIYTGRTRKKNVYRCI
jgi:hypothetical protein